MIIQWHRQKDSSYTARWSKIDFLLAQDPTTKLWSVRANGKKCTINGKLKTWKSAQAAMDDMDERQTALLMKKTATRLDVRPFMDRVAEELKTACSPIKAYPKRRRGLPPMTAKERALVEAHNA
jgi:hypothetical protein